MARRCRCAPDYVRFPGPETLALADPLARLKPGMPLRRAEALDSSGAGDAEWKTGARRAVGYWSRALKFTNVSELPLDGELFRPAAGRQKISFARRLLH